MKTVEQLSEELSELLGELVLERKIFRGELTLVVHKSDIIEVLSRLKHDGFNFLVDEAGVDYLGYPEPQRARFAVVYRLLSHSTGDRVCVKVPVPEDDLRLPTATILWKGANWPEREIFDMFGIVFDGHPDLRRILTPEGFEAFPLRKDYPIEGLGERERFPRLGKG